MLQKSADLQSRFDEAERAVVMPITRTTFRFEGLNRLMGITIHYRGTMDDIRQVETMEDRVLDLESLLAAIHELSESAWTTG